MVRNRLIDCLRAAKNGDLDARHAVEHTLGLPSEESIAGTKTNPIIGEGSLSDQGRQEARAARLDARLRQHAKIGRKEHA